jgi:hypothetical protein
MAMMEAMAGQRAVRRLVDGHRQVGVDELQASLYCSVSAVGND